MVYSMFCLKHKNNAAAVSDVGSRREGSQARGKDLGAHPRSQVADGNVGLQRWSRVCHGLTSLGSRGLFASSRGLAGLPGLQAVLWHQDHPILLPVLLIHKASAAGSSAVTGQLLLPTESAASMCPRESMLVWPLVEV